MSSPLHPPYPGASLAAPQFARHYAARGATDDTGRLTWTGVAFFFVTLLVALSVFERFRIPVGGLLIHAYLVPLAPMLAFVVLNRLGSFPKSALLAYTLFAGIYCVATLVGPSAAPEALKMLAAVATTITAALMVRSEKDFRLCVAGLVAAISFICIFGLGNLGNWAIGFSVVEMANENATSLYTLPALLLAGYVAMEPKASKLLRVALTVGVLIIVLATFSSANRSGWLCAVLIGFLLLGRKLSLRTVVYVVIFVGASYGVVSNFANLEMLQLRYEESVSGQKTTDSKRVNLAFACLEVGMDNPILGVSPQNVPYELPDYVEGTLGKIDAHNFFGNLIAGTGFVGALAFGWLGLVLLRSPPNRMQRFLPDGKIDKAYISPHRLLRMALILWFVRGMFSREILYSPSFSIAIGLAIGLCIVHGAWDVKRSRPMRPSGMPPGVSRG